MGDVKMEDYRTQDGSIDFKAYHKAQRDNGEKCINCGQWIFFGRGYPTRCNECKRLEDDTEEVRHSSQIRCPKCSQNFEVHTDYYELYEDGEHEVMCQNDECEHYFEITTHVSFEFVSPELLKGGDNE